MSEYGKDTTRSYEELQEEIHRLRLENERLKREAPKPLTDWCYELQNKNIALAELHLADKQSLRNLERKYEQARGLLNEFLFLVDGNAEGGEASPDFCRFVDKVRKCI